MGQLASLTMFHGSRRYECDSTKKPMAMILRTISKLKMIKKTISKT